MRENLYGSMFWRQLGTQVTIPRGHGSKVRISRWQTPVGIFGGQMKLSSATGGCISAIVQHAEATPISLFRLCAESITGQVTGWAGGRGYTDKTVIVSMANFMEGALESLARDLAFRLDRYDRTKVSGFAFTAYAVNRAGTKPVANKVPVGSALFGKNVARIRPLMGANGVPTWDDGTYVGIAHELAAHDMFTDISASGFVSTARYNDARMIYRGEVGEFYGVRWLLSNASVQRFFSSEMTLTAEQGLCANASGSHAYIFGPDAFYNLELETGGVEVWHQPLGSGGAPGDPVGQLGSIGVKVYYGVLPAPASDKRVMRFVHTTELGF